MDIIILNENNKIVIFSGAMRPHTPHQISFFFIAMKKERNLDKERKTTLPNTVSKLNKSLVNSRCSNKTRLVAVSLRDCRKGKNINLKFNNN